MITHVHVITTSIVHHVATDFHCGGGATLGFGAGVGVGIAVSVVTLTVVGSTLAVLHVWRSRRNSRKLGWNASIMTLSAGYFPSLFFQKLQAVRVQAVVSP